MLNIGTVFAGRRSPDIHNEIVKTYVSGGKPMVDVEQYGATLATKEHSKNVTFYAHEIQRALKVGNMHIILAR